MPPKSKNYIFKTTDPLGVNVSLTETSYTHITSGHPEMHGEEYEIRETVTNPDAIYSDKTYQHNFCYYRQHNSDTLRHLGANLKVVVDKSDTEGKVITAYPTSKRREKTIRVYKK